MHIIGNQNLGSCVKINLGFNSPHISRQLIPSKSITKKYHNHLIFSLYENSITHNLEFDTAFCFKIFTYGP
jgi:hypothetical protein